MREGDVAAISEGRDTEAATVADVLVVVRNLGVADVDLQLAGGPLRLVNACEIVSIHAIDIMMVAMIFNGARQGIKYECGGRAALSQQVVLESTSHNSRGRGTILAPCPIIANAIPFFMDEVQSKCGTSIITSDAVRLSWYAHLALLGLLVLQVP